jgi:hypothetical protein
MNPKKTKEKERRARKLADEAWQAVTDENLDLAEKIIRRAVATQPDNPVLWNDQGAILTLRGKDGEAADAFRAAISLAPTYTDPYTHLAAMHARKGYLQEAIRLLENAARLAPGVVLVSERLEAYRALAGSRLRSSDGGANVIEKSEAPASPTRAPEEASRWELPSFPWDDLGERLTQDGCVAIPAMLAPSECANLRSLFDDEARCAKTVAMDRDDFGRGVYRYFRAPIPELVDRLRRAVYPHVARIANRWQELLREEERFPDEWEGFRTKCAEAGQATPTPILLKYTAGGFNALHRDLRGAVFFPIQMAVVLSPRADGPDLPTDGFRGGEFLFCDVPEHHKSRRREVAAGLGDAVLFCTRDRLVKVGGAYGLQPVKHGVKPITEGTRLVLGVPFHEYR